MPTLLANLAMRTVPRLTTVVVVIAVAAACERGSPTEPTRSDPDGAVPTAAAPAAPPATAVTIPPAAGPSRTFAFDRPLSYPVRDYTRHSRFVIYDNGAFELQFPSGTYRGGWSTENGTIVFTWEGWSVAGAWEASGTLGPDSLEVRYGIIMQLTDFEDAVYRLVPQAR